MEHVGEKRDLEMGIEEKATYREIMSQTVAWEGALESVRTEAESLRELWQKGKYNQVLFTGCGSTYYLSLAAAALWQEFMDVPARGVPAGELYLYPKATYGATEAGRSLLVAISRSGTTSETVAIANRFKAEGRGEVVVITNYGDTPLAQAGHVTILIPEGQEESVAQTRSFASMYVAATALVMTLADRPKLLESMAGLRPAGDKILARYAELARNLGENLALDRFYFLGSGPRYGLACEVNLKMKEMTLTNSEPFHFFEFRHGPISMAGEPAVVIGLLSEKNRELEIAVLDESEELGSQVFTLADDGADVDFSSGLPEAIRNVLYLPVLQLMACYRSMAKDLNPDRPVNLSAVVELDLDE
jgi:glucosamine--fructose-6-phosphate aminotransferase (isomerizing)